jgi:hypothetical protein
MEGPSNILGKSMDAPCHPPMSGEGCKQVRTAWGIQGGRRRPQAARPTGEPPQNGIKAVLGVARPQGIEGLGMAGLGETLGSPWILLHIRAWLEASRGL